MMSGEYKFDSTTQRLSEVKLVGNAAENEGDYYTEVEESRGSKVVKSSNSPILKLIVVMQILIAFLLLVLILLVSFNTYQWYTDMRDCSNSANTISGTADPVQQCDNNTSTDAVIRTMEDIRNDTELIPKLVQTIVLNINSSNEISQQLHNLQNDFGLFAENTTDVIGLVSQQTEATLIKVMEIITTLANQKQLAVETSAVVNDILVVVEELLELQNASDVFNSIKPVSCADIKKVIPYSTSGYYHVNSRDIYCDMDELCGSGGGWTRIAYIDMADSTESCPTGLQLLQSAGTRACGRPSSSTASCSPSVKFPTNGLTYTEVCGRVNGYQVGSTDAVHTGSNHNDINSYYVDGISLTRGSPREHVWTFMTGLQESYYSHYNCPCNDPPGSYQQVQSFVGSNYFCESGNPNNYYEGSSAFYSADPLWDGKGCGSQEGECCSANGIPWFHRQYNTSSSEYFELRVCSDQDTYCEDSPFSFYEIYIK